MGYIHAHTTILNHNIKKYNKSQGQVLGWPKSSFGIFTPYYGRPPNEPFGEPNGLKRW